MKLYRLPNAIIIEDKDTKRLLEGESWDALINKESVVDYLAQVLNNLPEVDEQWLKEQTVLPPIESQEVWAAGVTYLRSMEARKEEAKDAGGDTFYDRVYTAERPELFFKSTPQRVVGSKSKVRIRRDSTWNVPEPELTLVINNKGKIVGYTIGNDMSSRSIEGENPLYLPQAKTYDGSAAVGPCVYLVKEPISPDTTIEMEINRGAENLYRDAVEISRMKRSQTELVEFLYRECSFPQGAYLMTGTCLVPPNDFTLQSGDEIKITIEPIGTLLNIVA